jgi:WD40 repeat protein
LSAKDPGVTGILLRGHDDTITDLAISPDSHWLVTGSYDKTARLWDLNSKDPAANPIVLRGHEGSINSVALSSDNRWLATVSDDKTARLWNLRLDELAELACPTAGRNLTKEEWRQYMGDQPYQKTCSEITLQEGRKKRR